MASKKTRSAPSEALPASEIRVVPLRDLNPAPYNPRRIDPAAMAALTKSLERFGYLDGLIERMLRNSTAPGHVVLDPFAGSGSTIIACERLNLRARALELDPLYVDVIVQRWQDFTGQKAILHRG